MIKSSKNLLNEATTLYSEHKAIQRFIQEKEEYMITAPERRKALAQRAIGITEESAAGAYFEADQDLGLGIYNAPKELDTLHEQDDQNMLVAQQHLVDNPKLVDLAVKLAKRDGITIKK